MRSGDVLIHGILQRSGTNYLARALRCHPDLAASPRSLWEFPHLRLSPPLVAYARSMARAPKLPALSEREVLEMIGDAWLAFAAEGLPEGRRLVLKEPSVAYLERFFEFFPRSRLLVLIRDGRDVAASSLRTTFASPGRAAWRHPRTWIRLARSPVRELAERWRDASRLVREFMASEGDAARARAIRYEDLAGGQEAEMRRILEFLGLAAERFDWDAFARLDVRGSSFVDNRNGTLSWSGSDPETFDPVGRWRRWDERRIRLFDRVAGEELRHWGYPDP